MIGYNKGAMTDSLATALLTALIGMGSAVISSYLTYTATIRKSRLEYAAQTKAAAVDDATQLRHDLLEERKILLNQLIQERQFYSSKIEGLEGRVRNLEEENRKKDGIILEQGGKLNEYELRMKAQDDLIQVLQGEISELKGHPHEA